MKNRKVYLVTGGAGGIGSAICLKIAEMDKNSLVLIHYNTSHSSAVKIKNKIIQDGGAAEIIQSDLESKSEVELFAKSILAKYSKVDCLINCAGYVRDCDVIDREYEDFEKTFRINLFAPFLLSKILGFEMVKNQSGQIINISSTNGVNTIYPTSIDYDASKAALNSLTRNLAIELAPYVNVNAVMPGWVGTPMNNELPEDFLEEEKKTTLLERFAEPEEIADMVFFLSSDKARYITAAIIPVDGGLKVR